MRTASLILLCTAVLVASGCNSCGKGDGKPATRVAASSDPEGKDLVEGAVVAAAEKSGGIRLYKIVKINWFPDPVGEELVMIAYKEKADSFEGTARLWSRGRLTVALPRVRVPRHVFVRRDHRVLVREEVTERELSAEAGDPQRSAEERQGRNK